MLARQAFDLMGRMWVPIIINFVQFIFLTFAFFGVIQYRLVYLTLFVIWTPFFMLWNMFLVCFFMNVKPLNRNERYLSFGSEQRLSHSFWVDYFPFCKASYNHVLDAWMSGDQEDKCFMHYYHMEIGIAAFFATISFIVLIVSVLFLCFSKRKHYTSSTSAARRVGVRDELRQGPSVTLEFTDPGAAPNRAVVSHYTNGHGPYTNGGGQQNYRSSSGASNDISSGYMNTSFETSPTPNEHPYIDPNGKLVSNYQRRSTKGGRSRSSGTRKPKAAAPSPRSVDDYSRAPTAEVADDADESGGVVGIERGRRSRSLSKPSTSQQHKTSAVGRPSRHRSSSPLGRMDPVRLSRNSNCTVESRISPDQLEIYQQPSMVHRDGQSFSRNLSNHSLRMAQNSAEPLISDLLSSAPPPPTSDSRRLSTTEVRGLRSSADSMLNTSQPFKLRDKKKRNGDKNENSQPTSLVSFDPKSNTLIRVREHTAMPDTTRETTDEETTFDDLPPPETAFLPAQNGYQNNQPPSFPAPPPTLDEVSHDSGMPHSGSISEHSYSNHIKQMPSNSLANYKHQNTYEPSYLGQRNTEGGSQAELTNSRSAMDQLYPRSEANAPKRYVIPPPREDYISAPGPLRQTQSQRYAIPPPNDDKIPIRKPIMNVQDLLV